jgi:hypothetical protein
LKKFEDFLENRIIVYKHTCGSGLIVAIQIAALLPFTLLVQQQGKMTSSNASTVVHTAENSSVNLTEHPPSQISIQEQSEKDSSDENIGEASSPQEPGKSTDGIAKKPLVVATEHEDDEDDALKEKSNQSEFNIYFKVKWIPGQQNKEEEQSNRCPTIYFETYRVHHDIGRLYTKRRKHQ